MNQMENKATVTVKMSKAELETLINSLDFKLSLNVPIDSNYLKPFAKLKNDLTMIKNITKIHRRSLYVSEYQRKSLYAFQNTNVNHSTYVSRPVSSCFPIPNNAPQRPRRAALQPPHKEPVNQVPNRASPIRGVRLRKAVPSSLISETRPQGHP